MGAGECRGYFSRQFCTKLDRVQQQMMMMMTTRCMSAVNGQWPTAFARLISTQQFLISYLQRSLSSPQVLSPSSPFWGRIVFVLSLCPFSVSLSLLLSLLFAHQPVPGRRHSLADLLSLLLPAGRGSLRNWAVPVRPIVCILRLLFQPILGLEFYFISVFCFAFISHFSLSRIFVLIIC